MERDERMVEGNINYLQGLRNEMFPHRKSVDEFLQLLVELFRCGIILNMYGFEVLYLITIYIYDLYQTTAHDDYTHTNPCPFQSMEKPLPSIFGNAHSLRMCSFQCLYSKVWLDTKVAFGNEQLHPCADSHFDSFK